MTNGRTEGMPQRRSRLGSSVVLPVLAAAGGTAAPRLGHKGNPAIIQE